MTLLVCEMSAVERCLNILWQCFSLGLEFLHEKERQKSIKVKSHAKLRKERERKKKGCSCPTHNKSISEGRVHRVSNRVKKTQDAEDPSQKEGTQKGGGKTQIIGNKREKNKEERKEEETDGGQTCIFLYFDSFLILK